MRFSSLAQFFLSLLHDRGARAPPTHRPCSNWLMPWFSACKRRKLASDNQQIIRTEERMVGSDAIEVVVTRLDVDRDAVRALAALLVEGERQRASRFAF